MTRWRRGWDSNPRSPLGEDTACRPPVRPLRHPSHAHSRSLKPIRRGWVGCPLASVGDRGPLAAKIAVCRDPRRDGAAGPARRRRRKAGACHFRRRPADLGRRDISAGSDRAAPQDRRTPDRLHTCSGDAAGPDHGMPTEIAGLNAILGDAGGLRQLQVDAGLSRLFKSRMINAFQGRMETTLSRGVAGGSGGMRVR